MTKRLIAIVLCLQIIAGLPVAFAQEDQPQSSPPAAGEPPAALDGQPASPQPQMHIGKLWQPDLVPQLQAENSEPAPAVLPQPRAISLSAPLPTPADELYYVKNNYTGKYKTAYDLMDEAVKNYDYSTDMSKNKGPMVMLPGITTEEEARIFLDAYISDHPELYSMTGMYGYLGYTDKSLVQLALDDPAKFDHALFESNTRRLLQAAQGKTTDYEKALALHDALLDQISYDMAAPHRQTAYGAIVDGKCVCDGYARAYQYLLQLSGIQSVRILGQTAPGYHAWNLVLLDGAYYYTDPTWDDTKDKRSYSYFNLPFIYINEDHTIDEVPGLAYPGGGTADKMYHNMFFLQQQEDAPTQQQIETRTQHPRPYMSRLHFYYTGKDPGSFSLKDWQFQNAVKIVDQLYPDFRYEHINPWGEPAGVVNPRGFVLVIQALPGACQVYNPADPKKTEGELQIPCAYEDKESWAELPLAARDRYDDGGSAESSAPLHLYTAQGQLILPEQYPEGIRFGEGAKSRTLQISSKAQPQVLLVGTGADQPKYALTLTPAADQWILGDHDKNGRVDQSDAYYLLMYTMKPEDFPLDGHSGDHDNNGRTDQSDAYYLLMYTMKPEDFPLEQVQ